VFEEFQRGIARLSLLSFENLKFGVDFFGESLEGI